MKTRSKPAELFQELLFELVCLGRDKLSQLTQSFWRLMTSGDVSISKYSLAIVFCSGMLVSLLGIALFANPNFMSVDREEALGRYRVGFQDGVSFAKDYPDIPLNPSQSYN
jgi:hypothetical protein